METWVTCQSTKPGPPAAPSSPSPTRASLPDTSARKVVLLPREIQGCAPSIPPSRALEGPGCSSLGSGVVFPQSQGTVLRSTCNPTVFCAPALSLCVPAEAITMGRKVHVGTLEVFKIKIRHKFQCCGTKRNPAKFLRRQKGEHMCAGGWQLLRQGKQSSAFASSLTLPCGNKPHRAGACLQVQHLRFS